MSSEIKACWLYYTRDADGFAQNVRRESVERETKPGEFKAWHPTGDFDKNKLHTPEALAKRAAEAEALKPPTRAEYDALLRRVTELEDKAQ
jgi:hypothetical protein